MNGRQLLAGATLCAALVAGGVAAGFQLVEGDEKAKPAAIEPKVALANGLDILPSSTAQDWAAYANVVATVTVVAERAEQVLQEDIERGEGTIGRAIDLHIDTPLWARPGQTVPDQVTINTLGWVWKDGDPAARTEFGPDNRPRLELGRQYLVALALFPGVAPEDLASCDEPPPADATEPKWGVLGTHAAAPVTNGIVGTGEFEGIVHTLQWLTSELTEELNATLRGELLGQPVETVEGLVQSAAAAVAPKQLPADPC